MRPGVVRRRVAFAAAGGERAAEQNLPAAPRGAAALCGLAPLQMCGLAPTCSYLLTHGMTKHVPQHSLVTCVAVAAAADEHTLLSAAPVAPLQMCGPAPTCSFTEKTAATV